MFGYKRTVIADFERGLLFVDRRLKRVLGPGVYRCFDPLGRKTVEVYDLNNPVFDHPQAETLLKTAGNLLAGDLQLTRIGENEVGLVRYDGVAAEVLAPNTQRVYWRGLVDVKVERQDVSEDFALPTELAAVLARPTGGPVPSRVSSYIRTAEVSDHSVGLLLVDGELKETLKPGFHAFWKFNRAVTVEQLDTRVQTMEVAGQEILTRDKVSLRVNLDAQYRVADAVKARQALKNPIDWLYRELQFALRQAIGTRTLDALLGDKDEPDQVIFKAVAERAEAHGMLLSSIGVRDVILPGDMKAILNQVVEAEKVAQANVIRRREETAATRSLLNTAKLMNDNPTLLRLKELETLEKVTEKVDRMTVYGGLESVLKDTVRINV